MKYNVPMRKETVTINADETYTVKGGGWFWCKIQRTSLGLAIVEMAPGMLEKKAARLFLSEAKLTIAKHFPACIECGNVFDDNPNKDICKTCEDWIVTE